MEKRKIINLGVSFLIISMFISMFYSFLPIDPLNQTGKVIGFLVGLAILIYLGYLSGVKFLLLLLFLTFGWMNLPLKPFDLLFVLIFPLYFMMKQKKLNYLQDLRFINYSFAAFIMVSLLSVLVSSDINKGLSFFIHTFYMLVIFYFIAVLIRTEIEFKSIIWGYIISTLISSIAVIIELSGLVVNIGTLFMGIRARGFFNDPNDFSPYLILAILLLIEKAFKYSFFSIKYFIFVSLAFLLFFVLLASMSRAALLNVTITLLIYLFYTVVYRKLFTHTAILVILGSLALLFTFIFFGDSVQNQLYLRFSNSAGNGLQSYDSERFYFQLTGLMLGFSHILGIGPGQFELLYGYATHNLFVRIIAENGWIAFAFFFIILIYVLRKLYIYRKNMVWNLPIYLFLAVYIGILINSMFLDTLHWRYFWFFLGLCCVIVKKAKTNYLLEKVK